MTSWVDDLHRLAEKAIPGPWYQMTDHRFGTDAEFIAACSPERVLALARVHKAAEEYLGLSTYDVDPKNANSVWFESAQALDDALAAGDALEEGE